MNCRGDEDIDAKRSRPSIGKPVMGHARKERVVLFGTDQRITSGPAAKRPHSKAEYMTAPERFADSQIPLAPRAPSIHDSPVVILRSRRRPLPAEASPEGCHFRHSTRCVIRSSNASIARSSRRASTTARWPFTNDARPSSSVLIQHSPELRRKEGEQRTLVTANQHSQSRGSVAEGHRSYGFCAMPSLAENVRYEGAGGGRVDPTFSG